MRNCEINRIFRSHYILYSTRTLFLFVLFILFSINVFSQEEETVAEETMQEEKYLFKGDMNVDGMLSIDFNFMKFSEQISVFTKAGGGLFFGKHIFVGGYFAALLNKANPDREPYSDKDLSFNYGGPWFGFLFLPDKKFKVLVSFLFGWGGFSLSPEGADLGDFKIDKYDHVSTYTPAAELQYAITKHIDIGLGCSYNLLKYSNLENYDDSDFSGFGVSVSLKLSRLSFAGNKNDGE